MIAIVNPEDEFFKELEQLDLSGINFPSDNLSVKKLREAHPELFDKGFDGYGGHQPKFFLAIDTRESAEHTVGNMLHCERVVALVAYATARGHGNALLINVEDFKEELEKYYTRYGIAKGAYHARELIQDIERQATRLGQQRSP